jgi:CBS domain containing-hemolysin-like protein
MFSSIAIALLLIALNGFFVAAEFALVKVRASQLDLRAANGNRMAVVAREILEHLDAYLSASQVGITLASLGLGWVGEPAVAAALDPLFQLLSVPPDIAHHVSLGFAFVTISFIHIVVGEQAPKNLAIAAPEHVALAVAYPMRALYLVSYPALFILNGSSNLILRTFGIEPAGGHDAAVPAEELRQIAARSAQQGEITQGQSSLLSKVFTFSDRVAREIMVPRSKVRGIDLRRPVDEALSFALENGHSRYPLYDRDLDGVVGVLHMKDLMPRLRAGQPIKSLKELARPALFVPETLPAQRLLRIFQRQRSHLAVVLDEYGGVTGVITIEDTLEELVGEIQDEHDDERLPIETIDGGWSVEGRTLLSEIEGLLGIPPIQSEATSLSGFVMEELGRVAQVGDTVVIGEWAARVVQVERRAIERVEIMRAGETVAEAPARPE